MENVDFRKALKDAQSLPTHVDGSLQEKYRKINPTEGFFILYENDEPCDIFRAAHLKEAYRSGAEGFYIKEVPTHRPDGNLYPKRYWKEVLMYHQKWARKDVEVKRENISYEIVGLKRETTNLPAGVLISNVKINI